MIESQERVIVPPACVVESQERPQHPQGVERYRDGAQG